VPELTHVQDILPTLIELCVLPMPENRKFDGVSLAPLLRGERERLADRMLVIQFSRMNAPRPQKGDACVLWQKWRLIANKELYDVGSDLAQQRDVAESHPEVVSRMKRHYDAWWSGVESQMNEFSPVVLGAENQNPTLLSPCEWADVFLDQSRQVRQGERKNGVWHVEIDRDGEYEFVLRRWPVEAEAALSAGLPPYQGVDGIYPAGVALPIAKARMKIADFDQSLSVQPDETGVTFIAPLKASSAQLQTWFYAADGQELCGAYYIDVRRK
jgi:hypothetical protein